MGVATLRCCGCAGSANTLLDIRSPTEGLLCEKVINLNTRCQPNPKVDQGNRILHEGV